MLLGVVLLYVGAVLSINGIWLIGQARAASRQLRGEEQAGARSAREAVSAVEAHPTFINGREVAVINVFTAFIGIVAATTYLVQGNAAGDLGSVRGSGFVLLFAFTYLWVTLNQFLNAGGHAFGWYCLFVAVTAIPAGVYTLTNAHGNTASIWLGVDWFAWSLLWFLFWVLLSLERPIGLVTGAVALIEGIGTSWALAIAILEGKLSF
jgi:putative amide transporter protein